MAFPEEGIKFSNQRFDAARAHSWPPRFDCLQIRSRVTHTRIHYGHSEEGLADLSHTYSAQLSNYSRAKNIKLFKFKFKNVIFSVCLQISNFSLDEKRVIQTYVTLQHNLRKKGRNIKEWITKIDARLILRFLLEVRLQFESLSNNRAN